MDSVDNEHSYDVDSYNENLKMAKYALKLAGLRLTCVDSKHVKTFWEVYFWMFFCSIAVALYLETANMVETYKAGAFMDLFLMTPCVGFGVVALTKSYKIVRYREVFENIISELRNLWPQGRVTEDQHDFLRKMIKEIRIVEKGYFWTNLVLIFIVASPPYIQLIKRAMGKDVPLIFAFAYWTPFDPYQPGYYEAMVIIQTLQCFTIVLYMLSADLLFFLFISNLTTQFNLLALRIRKMIAVPVDEQLIPDYPLGKYSKNVTKTELEVTMEVQNETHLNKIKETVRRHVKLIRLSHDVEQMYSFAMLFNFLNSSIILCFCGFCCVFVEKWNELMYKFFLTTAISQVWMVCWYGQRLIDSSSDVADALYESGWYKSSREIKSAILIMMHRAQNEVHVTTYGFSVISLESYSTIIKTSWSYFTLLINLYKQ